MKSLNDLWFEACEELWEVSKDRPYIRDEATLWEAFEFMYLSKVNEGNLSGRKIEVM